MIVRRDALCAAALAVLMPMSTLAQADPTPQSGGVRPDVIYGDDDRLDLWQSSNQALKDLADSTAALFQGSGVSMSEDGKTANLATHSYGDSYGLCDDEPFKEQSAGAFCSGSLVGPDTMMTAGHCIRSAEACKTTKFVFGFGIAKEGGKTPDKVGSSEVYGCAELIGREEVGTGADWALVKLDRTVTNHKVLKVNRSGAPAKGTPLVVIGHPAGLPTKIAGGASVRDHKNGYFTANLDTYGGNSGSAVFNAVTGQIEGILVRGENDYVYDSEKQCRRSNVCTADGCRGEDVTAIGALVGRIPTGAGESLRAFSENGDTLQSLKGMSGEASR
ncbi:MAG: trypsin-like peptidase domain-containing protein [Elusimicrobia bacterium]|nr:trypsin-like peptidase domain-containing protein [Elusimicrobiota bacterium]